MPVSEIEGFINRMAKDNKISASYQRSLVGAIKKLYELTLDEKVKFDYLCPKRNFSSLPKFFSKDEIKRVFDATDNLKHKAMLMTNYSCGTTYFQGQTKRKKDFLRNLSTSSRMYAIKDFLIWIGTKHTD